MSKEEIRDCYGEKHIWTDFNSLDENPSQHCMSVIISHGWLWMYFILCAWFQQWFKQGIIDCGKKSLIIHLFYLTAMLPWSEPGKITKILFTSGKYNNINYKGSYKYRL